MHLHQLDLEEFRLYRRASLNVDPSGVLISGSNGSGKSTIVEAIALLATMRSPRTGSDRELINFESGVSLGFPPYARAIGRVERLDGPVTVEVGLQVDGEGTGALRKSVKVNGRSVRAVDAVGTLKVVLFTPEDVALTSGSPSVRRRYLDILLSQLELGYVRSLSRYSRVLEQRNSLLKQLQKSGRPASDADVAGQLVFWDDELVLHGGRIIAARIIAMRTLGERAAERFAPFGTGRVELAYAPSVGESFVATGAEMPFDALGGQLALAMRERQERERRDEVRRGVTLSGPHRDDFTVLLDGQDVGTFGSRGQQRLTVVALKLAEADVMAERAGETPVVLLDDVLSELDAANRERLLDALGQSGCQLIVTTADEASLVGPMLDPLPRIHVERGVIGAGANDRHDFLT